MKKMIGSSVELSLSLPTRETVTSHAQFYPGIHDGCLEDANRKHKHLVAYEMVGSSVELYPCQRETQPQAMPNFFLVFMTAALMMLLVSTYRTGLTAELANPRK